MEYYEKVLSKLKWGKLYKALKLGEPERKGDERIFICPFHDEDTGSFYLNKEHGAFHCFGCDEAGNIITLVASLKDITNKEAFEKIEGWAGLGEGSLTVSEVKQRVRAIKLTLGKRKRKKLDIHTDDMPKTIELHDEALAYLKKRQITRKEIGKRKIRFCDYGYFKDRLIIPLYDSDGKYRTFEARLIRNVRVIGKDKKTGKDIKERKVLYPYDSVTRDLVYNINRCYGDDQIILTEGIMDNLSMTSRGIKNCVTCLGVALTSWQEQLLYNNFDDMVVLYDYDGPGIDAAKKIKEDLQSFMDITVCYTFKKKDIKHLELPVIEMALKKSTHLGEPAFKMLRKKLENIG